MQRVHEGAIELRKHDRGVGIVFDERSNGVFDLSRVDRGVESFAADIRDEKQAAVLVDAVNVEEVAADCGLSCRGYVCGADAKVRQRIPAAQERALQRIGYDALAFERHLRARSVQVGNDRSKPEEQDERRRADRGA